MRFVNLSKHIKCPKWNFCIKLAAISFSFCQTTCSFDLFSVSNQIIVLRKNNSNTNRLINRENNDSFLQNQANNFVRNLFLTDLSICF